MWGGQGKGRLKDETQASGLHTQGHQDGGKTWGAQESHEVLMSLVDKGKFLQRESATV